MIIKNIEYNLDFYQQFKKLPANIRRKAVKAEALMRDNIFHPSLRLHKLKGRLQDTWSVSVDRKYRIVFKPVGNGTIILFSIGMHAIYDV